MLKQLQGTIEEESGEASGSQLELIERLKGKPNKHRYSLSSLLSLSSSHTHTHTHARNIMQRLCWSSRNESWISRLQTQSAPSDALLHFQPCLWCWSSWWSRWRPPDKCCLRQERDANRGQREPWPLPGGAGEGEVLQSDYLISKYLFNSNYTYSYFCD